MHNDSCFVSPDIHITIKCLAIWPDHAFVDLSDAISSIRRLRATNQALKKQSARKGTASRKHSPKSDTPSGESRRQLSVFSQGERKYDVGAYHFPFPLAVAGTRGSERI